MYRRRPFKGHRGWSRSRPTAASPEALEPRRLLATFNVNSPADTGPGTLRAAILAANATVEHDVVAFNLPDPAQPILPTGALPDVTQPLTIFGATQRNYSGTPLVRISGAAAGPGVDGLRLVRKVTLNGVAVINFSGDGVVLAGTLSADQGQHVVESCSIGVDPANPGVPAGNGGDGIEINTSFCVVGGGSSRNVISGNGENGIRIRPLTGADPARQNRVIGNYVGVGADRVANGQAGVRVEAPSNAVGGDTPAEGNVISGNGLSGVVVQDGASSATVAGNLIGTTAAGTFRRPNGRHGVELLDSGADVLNNVISANVASGVHIGAGASFNRVQGNFIGTDRAGQDHLLGNGAHGVLIDNAYRNLIGGTENVQGNVIARNQRNGVAVLGGDGDTNSILRNSMRSNAQLGIDLGDDGVTPNDPGDADGGPNLRQNFPLITTATSDGAAVRVRGTLDSTPNGRFRLEFFATFVPDPSGHGEGDRFVGAGDVRTDAGGAATFDFSFPATVQDGDQLTATATRLASIEPSLPLEDTSEFSPRTSILPGLAGVFVAGSSWTRPFLDELAEKGLGDAAAGYRVGPARPGSVLLPWSNVDTVRFRFSRNVSVQQDDLALASGAGIPYAVSSFNYNPATYTATLVFDRPLADYPRLRRTADVLLLTLDGDGPDGVFSTDPFGSPRLDLDGGDFTQRLYAVPGDANRNASVSPTDYGTVRSGVGRSTTDEVVSPNHYTVFKDVNANGNVSPTDVGIVRGNTGANVSDVPQPAANPHDAAVSSITSDLFATKSLLN